jgi:two-component system OmpR family sensor kinase
LRSRLALAIAALAAVALIFANVAGLVLLRSYLTDRVDRQLNGISSRLGQPPDRKPLGGLLQGPGAQGQRSGSFPAGLVPNGQVTYRFNASGTLDLSESTTSSDQTLSPPKLGSFAELRAHAGTGPFTVGSQDGNSRWRVIAVNRVGSQTGGVAVTAISLQDIDLTADRLLAIDATVTLLVLLLIGLAAAWVVRIGMRPLTRMETMSAEISAGDLSRRVDDADPHTEPGRLGIALNSMLGRIESEIAARTTSEQRLRQFVADASHELRTPLTSIRGFAELYRRGGAPSGPLLDETMSRIESEAARMGLLVDDLILLARLDLRRPMDRRQVDLLAIAADTIRDAHARMPDRSIRLSALDEASDTFEPVTVLGDESRLRQVATNLVANALQHTPDKAEITVRVGRWDARRRLLGPPVVAAVGAPPPIGSAAVLEVADTGPGVPLDHAQRVFERLYRVDPSRTRALGGSGLGLSIVAAIVHSHGGRVELTTGSGKGSTFRVLLPAETSPVG